MSAKLYEILHIFRKNSLPFTRKIINSTLFVESPFSCKDDLGWHNADGTITYNDVLSIQQNVCGGDRFYQNTLQLRRDDIVWHIEDFLPSGTLNNKLIFPQDGQIYLTSGPGKSDLPQIPSSVKDQLKNGDMTINFATSDNGFIIMQKVTIIETQKDVILFDPGWYALPNTISWYSPLYTASLEVVGVGLGSTATFSSGSFLITQDADTDDLAYGGTYWQDGIPSSDPVPGLIDTEGEHSNLRYEAVVDTPIQLKFAGRV